MLYLALTIPLTHLVNYIDARLRCGRTATGEEDLQLASTQEMI